jgi:ArsR family transcriptional regulator
VVDIMRFMAVPIDPDVQLLSALADPIRLGIVRQLAADNEVCACNLDACRTVRQPTVSHHLRVLREAGIVTSQRRGTWVYYRLAPDAASRLGAVAATLVPGGLIPAGSLARRSGSAGALQEIRRDQPA